MERNTNQINNYLDLSPRLPGSSSPINFERAPTPGLSSFTPKPFISQSPTNYHYSSPSKQYQAQSPKPDRQTQKQKQQRHQEEEHQPPAQEQHQEDPQAQSYRETSDKSSQIQRKRRQDDLRKVDQVDQEESSLSEPPSEPEVPIEPSPKRVKVKKITRKIKQSAKPTRDKQAELTDSESTVNNNLEPPQPSTESVTLPSAKSTAPESNRLSNLSFKRKQGPQKRNKSKPAISSSNPGPTSSAKSPTKRPAPDLEVQEDLDIAENHDHNPPSSNHRSPTDYSTHQCAEPTSSHTEIKPQQQQHSQSPSHLPPSTQDQGSPNSYKPNTRTSSNTATNPSSKKPTDSSKNPPQTSTKKPVKPSFKKTNKASTSSTLPVASSTPKPSTPSLNQPRKKTGEYDLNDPTTWGALFGGGDKKPAAKPVKPGNLPPQAALYNGTAADRLEARKKQRAEEKKILHQQMKIGFDLLRQNIDMMDFEIEYKNHVRVMVERPLSPGYLCLPNESSESTSGAKQTQVGVVGGCQPVNVLCRPDGYKRYLNPPPPSSSAPPVSSSQPPPALSHQPPGPIYSSSFGPDVPRKTLPRPGMFGSSFFIWQAPHLP